MQNFLIRFLIISIFTLTNTSATLKNAMWSQGNYLREYFYADLPIKIKVEEEDYKKLYQLTSNHNIEYNFLFLSSFNTDGTIRLDDNFEQIKEKFEKIKKNIGNKKLLPWIGGIQNKQIFLENESWRKNAIKSTIEICRKLGTDSVHLNFEYLLYETQPDSKINYTKNFNAFFQELKKETRGSLYISTVIPSTSSLTTPFKQKHTQSEVVELGRFVNQISFLFYDTKIDNKKDYEKSLEQQIDFNKILYKKYPKLDVLIGIGTFENGFPPARKYRNPVVEDLEYTLELLTRYKRKDPHSFTGVSFFSEWLTSDNEWEIIKKKLQDVE